VLELVTDASAELLDVSTKLMVAVVLLPRSLLLEEGLLAVLSLFEKLLAVVPLLEELLTVVSLLEGLLAVVSLLERLLTVVSLLVLSLFVVELLPASLLEGPWLEERSLKKLILASPLLVRRADVALPLLELPGSLLLGLLVGSEFVDEVAALVLEYDDIWVLILADRSDVIETEVAGEDVTVAEDVRLCVLLI
jgi:hypothetical protein